MKLRAFHLDFNSVALKPDAVLGAIEAAAAVGCNAILWEVEDKIRWETCPEAVHPDAFSKSAFRAILAHAAELGLEPIPLLQTCGHAEYVLMQPALAHLRELPSEYDCYCASNPDVRTLLRRWIAEYRDLFGPVRLFHLGGDEAYHFGKCPRCAARNRLELYAEHLLAVSEDLRRDGVKVCIWDDFSRRSMWWNEAKATSAAPDISPLRPFVLWNWEYSPESDFFHAAELAADGFETMVAGSVSSYSDDPFLPNWTRHLQNLAAMRLAAEAPDVQTLQSRIPELLVGLDEAEALAAGGGGKESSSFPVLLLTAIALKRKFLEALGAAIGATGRHTPSPEALMALRHRTADFYSLEMTTSTAERAAAIVWNPLVDHLFV